MTKKSEAVVIPKFEPKELEVSIVGISPLLCNRITEKVASYLPGGSKEGEKADKDSRSWKEKALDAAYRHPETGEYVFPSAGLMGAVASAGYRMGLVKDKVGTYANVQIPDEWLVIEGSAPRARQDTARNKNNGGALVMANRAEFKEWKMSFRIQFNAAEYDPKKVGMLIEAAGFGVGIGCWRPEKGGRFGRFKLQRDLG